MNKKWIMTTLLLLCCGVIMAQTSEAFKVGDLYYKITGENTVTIAASLYLAAGEEQNYYYGDLTEVTIPEKITYQDVEYDVTAMEIGAFAVCRNLRNIQLSGKITYIPLLAFAMSGLEYIEIPEGVVTIEQGAFGVCNSLQQVVLPSSLQTIAPNAFTQSYSLKMVIMNTIAPPALSYNSEMIDTNNFLVVVPQHCMTTYKRTAAWDNFHMLEMGDVWVEVAYSDDPSHTLTFFSNPGKNANIVIAEIGKQVEYILFNDTRIERNDLTLTTFSFEGLGEVPVCIFSTPKLVGDNVKYDALASRIGSKKATVYVVYGEETEVVTDPAAGEILNETNEGIERTKCITVQYPGKEIKSVDYTRISITKGVESGIIIDQSGDEDIAQTRRQAHRDVEVYSVVELDVPGQSSDAFSFSPLRYGYYINEKGEDVIYTANTLLPGYCYVVTLAEGAVTFADDSKSPVYSWEFKMAIGTGVEELAISGSLAYNGNEVVASDSEALIMIYDMRGVLVATGRGRVDVSSLASGLYITKSNKDYIKIAL